MPDASFYAKLYPLQDAVLNRLNGATNFYLTGGTAISRFHYGHRYSEDLDFFLNHSNAYRDEAMTVVQVLEDAFPKVKIVMDMEAFVRIIVEDDEGTNLKVELINDVGYRYGEPVDNGVYHKVDIPRNILSNKLCALSRGAAKDVSDIITICKNQQFLWPDLFDEANKKDTWANVLTSVKVLSTMTIDSLIADVDWVKPPDPRFLEQSIIDICTDIVRGEENTLYQKP